MSKSKVRIDVTIDNKRCSTAWVDSKTVFNPYPDPKISPLGPQKWKKTPKLGQNKKIRVEENIENKSR